MHEALTLCAQRPELRQYGSTELSARHKVNATNTWAVALFRYSFPSIRWYRTALMILDKDTRSVLRGFQSHHRNAALERIYLPRREGEGGRGLHRLSHVSEREVVSAALNVVRKAESDEHLRAVYQHQLERKALMKYTTLGEAERILNDRGMEVCAHRPECFEGSPETTRRSLNERDEE